MNYFPSILTNYVSCFITNYKRRCVSIFAYTNEDVVNCHQSHEQYEVKQQVEEFAKALPIKSVCCDHFVAVFMFVNKRLRSARCCACAFGKHTEHLGWLACELCELACDII